MHERRDLGRGLCHPTQYSWRSAEFDAVVAMYRDQGHIPVKLLGFEEGVNVTIGLIIRTSVDHGTADIARKGHRRSRSLLEAVRVAAEMAKARASALQTRASKGDDDFAGLLSTIFSDDSGLKIKQRVLRSELFAASV
jgi:hypothetical protein